MTCRHHEPSKMTIACDDFGPCLGMSYSEQLSCAYDPGPCPPRQSVTASEPHLEIATASSLAWTSYPARDAPLRVVTQQESRGPSSKTASDGKRRMDSSVRPSAQTGRPREMTAAFA